MNWLASIGKFLFGKSSGGSVVNRAMDLVSEKIEDPDKRIAAILDLTKSQLQAETQPAWLSAIGNWPNLTLGARAAISGLIWLDAVHKLGRLLLWAWVVWMYVEAMRAAQQPLDIETMLMLAGGPALYTMLKGRGR